MDWLVGLSAWQLCQTRDRRLWIHFYNAPRIFTLLEINYLNSKKFRTSPLLLIFIVNSIFFRHIITSDSENCSSWSKPANGNMECILPRLILIDGWLKRYWTLGSLYCGQLTKTALKEWGIRQYSLLITGWVTKSINSQTGSFPTKSRVASLSGRNSIVRNRKKFNTLEWVWVTRQL